MSAAVLISCKDGSEMHAVADAHMNDVPMATVSSELKQRL